MAATRAASDASSSPCRPRRRRARASRRRCALIAMPAAGRCWSRSHDRASRRVAGQSARGVDARSIRQGAQEIPPAIERALEAGQRLAARTPAPPRRVRRSTAPRRATSQLIARSISARPVFCRRPSASSSRVRRLFDFVLDFAAAEKHHLGAHHPLLHADHARLFEPVRPDVAFARLGCVLSAISCSVL